MYFFANDFYFDLKKKNFILPVERSRISGLQPRVRDRAKHRGAVRTTEHNEDTISSFNFTLVYPDTRDITGIYWDISSLRILHRADINIEDYCMDVRITGYKQLQFSLQKHCKAICIR